MKANKVQDALFGLSVGDALGVPVEFWRRETLRTNPVVDMRGYGTHNQPAGTWSDDSSLAFCLADSLCNGYNLADIASRFVRWHEKGHWTPHGYVFDVGDVTFQALEKLMAGTDPRQSGGRLKLDNGNGSLMRILPLVFYLKNQPIAERFRMIAEVSAITHGHVRSILACFIYCEYALQLLQGQDKYQALQLMQQSVKLFLREANVCSYKEKQQFHRVLERPADESQREPFYRKISRSVEDVWRKNLLNQHPGRGLDQYLEDEIGSSGYVLHTLEASLWCFLTTNDYTEAVLKAVNLGDDTDTTGCVTGGLAGIYYGTPAIPRQWVEALAKRDEIIALAERLNAAQF